MASKFKYFESFLALNDREKRLSWWSTFFGCIPLDWVVGCILFVLALAFNFFRLGVPGIWFDEAFSVELARQPLPLIWHIIFGPEPNMELYYLFLHGWLGMIGALGFPATEFVVRFPSAIFAALASFVLFILGRRFLHPFAATVGALLYLLNNLQLTYAQQTRSYALQLLLLSLAWYALFRALTPGYKRRWWGLYIVANTLAVYTHLFSILILLAQLMALCGLWILPGEMKEAVHKQWRIAIASPCAIGLGILPMLWESLQGAKTGWLDIPHRADLYHLFATIGGDSRLYLLLLVSCILPGCSVSALLLFSSSWRHRWLIGQSYSKKQHLLFMRQQALFPYIWATACWLVLPIIISYGVSHGTLRLFSTRYLVTVVPPFFLLVAAGIEVMRWRVVQMGAVICLILCALLVVPSYYENAQVEDWNTISVWLAERYQQQDGLVCYDNEMNQGCQISLEYYLHTYDPAVHFDADTPGAFSWSNFGPVNQRVGFAAAADPASLQPYAAEHQRLFYVIGRLPDAEAAQHVGQARQWLDQHYHFVDQLVTSTVTIRLYLTQ
ncbi:glycosyltransferase family 39 protein [Tengunoibacter tsumagoiensis]|uniref:Glycosyltransferase RgtA/B/C/D-like domain-containing protein n=1 Tax=Tengunoibacter tsumagoiensis TaxID=2014871 RepID=A0A402A531_9CHLR|nr:glycosyltransferase family 39 protein [Tengunoibacter tsumagoiensis]GCE14111.1 hypothetical protein KTT_39700 [Tengunoibacter tsumagoiensis]